MLDFFQHIQFVSRAVFLIDIDDGLNLLFRELHPVLLIPLFPVFPCIGIDCFHLHHGWHTVQVTRQTDVARQTGVARHAYRTRLLF